MVVQLLLLLCLTLSVACNGTPVGVDYQVTPMMRPGAAELSGFSFAIINLMAQAVQTRLNSMADQEQEVEDYLRLRSLY